MPAINRRNFCSKMLKGMNALLAMGLISPAVSAMAAITEEAANLHYRPLNGTRLIDIAKRKLHHGKNRFVNPLGLTREGRFMELLKWKLFSMNKFSQHLDDQPVIPVKVDWEKIREHEGVSITFLKHAGFLIKDGSYHLLIDPVFDKIFWFIEDFSPLSNGFQDNMPKPDEILITHGHYDHLDMHTLQRFDKDVHIISPLGYHNEFNKLGLQNRAQLDWFDAHTANGREITLLPCNHWTMRNPIEGPNTSLWGSYLIRTQGGYTIYVSGDTAYFDGFEQIGDTYDIDLAIFNLGAYEPRWFMAQSHLNPDETVQAFKALKARKLIIAHWGTFRLGDEPVHFPPLEIGSILTRNGMDDRWIDIRHGESFLVD